MLCSQEIAQELKEFSVQQAQLMEDAKQLLLRRDKPCLWTFRGNSSPWAMVADVGMPSTPWVKDVLLHLYLYAFPQISNVHAECTKAHWCRYSRS